MMRNITSRLQKLETEFPAEPLVVIVDRYSVAGGRLSGYECIANERRTVRTMRKPCETDEQLLQRAEAAGRPVGSGVIVLSPIYSGA
jgi:hypothetical protein